MFHLKTLPFTYYLQIIFLVSKRTYYCCALDVKVAIFYLFFLDFTILIDRNIGLLGGPGLHGSEPIIFPFGSVDLKTSPGLVWALGLSSLSEIKIIKFYKILQKL